MKFLAAIIIKIILSLCCQSLFAANSALLLLDMEEYFIIDYDDNERLSHNNKIKLASVIHEQIKVIRAAKVNKIPIVVTLYGSWGELLPVINKELIDYENLIIVRKENNNLFYAGFGNEENRVKVLDFLQENSVKNVLVLGANGGACVQSTIVGAISEGYKVIAYTRGIIDFNYRKYIYPYRLNDYSKVDELAPPVTLSKNDYLELNNFEQVINIFVNHEDSPLTPLTPIFRR